MVDRTSTGIAPWTLVEANDKGYARVKILRTICERLEAELEGKPIPRAKPEKPPKDDKKTKTGKAQKGSKELAQITAKPVAAKAPQKPAAVRAPLKPARPEAPAATVKTRPKKGKTTP